MKKLLTCLVALTSLSAFANRPAQYCKGSIVNPLNGKIVNVSYSETKCIKGNVCSIRVAVGELESGLATYEQNEMKATIDINPAGAAEVVISKRAAEEILIILQRNGSSATLTYLNDQNSILSNQQLKCSDNDDI